MSLDLDRAEHLRDVFLNLLGTSGGWVPFDGLAILVHEELGKIPLDVSPWKLTQLGLQILEERVGVGAIDINLLKGRVADAIAFNECTDLLRCAWLLTSKLVAGKEQHSEGLPFILALQLLQLLIVGLRQASSGGHVDD